MGLRASSRPIRVKALRLAKSLITALFQVSAACQQRNSNLYCQTGRLTMGHVALVQQALSRAAANLCKDCFDSCSMGVSRHTLWTPMVMHTAHRTRDDGGSCFLCVLVLKGYACSESRRRGSGSRQCVLHRQYPSISLLPPSPGRGGFKFKSMSCSGLGYPSLKKRDKDGGSGEDRWPFAHDCHGWSWFGASPWWPTCNIEHTPAPQQPVSMRSAQRPMP